MRRGGGKAKGSSAERNAAELIDQWYNVPKKTFWRTSNSGAWAEEPGDLKSRDTALTGKPWWMIEVKHVKSLDLLRDVVGEKNSSTLYNWLAEMQAQHLAWCAKGNTRLEQLLLFKQNHAAFLIAFDLSLLQHHNFLISKLLTLPHIGIRIPEGAVGVLSNKSRITLLSRTLVVMRWEDFISLIPEPKTFNSSNDPVYTS